MGPCEYIVIEFSGRQFNGALVPELAKVTNAGAVRIIDLVFVQKDADGHVTATELSDLPEAQRALFDELDAEIDDLFNEEDIAIEAAKLEPNSASAMIVFEHTWAVGLRDAIVASGGRVVDNERVPAAIVEAALEAARATAG
ncbi:MAG: DUF6325 family protein [Anaerolineae bacterium]